MIGARMSLHPMTDGFEHVVLGAVEALQGAPLERCTDDVSTFVHGEENALFQGIHDTYAAACERAGPAHLVMSLTLSRGCPGEPGEDVCDPSAAPTETPQPLRDAEGREQRVACQFSLYPMGAPDYMRAIYDVIQLDEPGVEVTPQNLCTRLEGSWPAVLGQLRTAFDQAAEITPHVVIHATLAVNSPSRRD